MVIKAKEAYRQFDKQVTELLQLESKLDQIVNFIIDMNLTIDDCNDILGIHAETFADLMEYNYSKFTIDELLTIGKSIADYIEKSGN